MHLKKDKLLLSNSLYLSTASETVWKNSEGVIGGPLSPYVLPFPKFSGEFSSSIIPLKFFIRHPPSPSFPKSLIGNLIFSLFFSPSPHEGNSFLFSPSPGGRDKGRGSLGKRIFWGKATLTLTLPPEGWGKRNMEVKREIVLSTAPQDTPTRHREPRFLVWRGDPEFLIQCNLLF